MSSDVVSTGSVVLGSLAIVSLVVRELFSYLKRQEKDEVAVGHHATLNTAILQELRTMNSNHLHHIETAITNGNMRLIESMHDDHTKMIEVLGRIEGALTRR